MKNIRLLFLTALCLISVSLFAQSPVTQNNKTEKVKFSCPMHPEVTSDKAGTCSKCGMNLKKSKEEQLKMETVKIYSCPMHPEVTSDKAGTCSKCGMDLKKSNKKQLKMETMKIYSCPMHPEVTSDKAGTCSKCGMDLKKSNMKGKSIK